MKKKISSMIKQVFMNSGYLKTDHLKMRQKNIQTFCSWKFRNYFTKESFENIEAGFWEEKSKSAILCNINN